MGNITDREYQDQFQADFSRAEPPRKRRKVNPNSREQEDYAFTSSKTKSGLTVGVTMVQQSAENVDPKLAKALGIKKLRRLPHIAFRSTKLVPDENFRGQARKFARQLLGQEQVWCGKSSFHDLLTCSEFARDYLFGEEDVWDWEEHSIQGFLRDISTKFQSKPRPNKAFGFLLPLILKDKQFATISKFGGDFNLMIVIIANVVSPSNTIKARKKKEVKIVPHYRINTSVELEYGDGAFSEEERRLLDVLAQEMTETLLPFADAINQTHRICPLYLRGVRDGFSHRPIAEEKKIGKITRKDWYIDLRREHPKQSIKNRTFSGERVHSGIVTFDNVFAESELKALEQHTDNALEQIIRQNSAQRTQSKNETNRTKYFWGFRYLDKCMTWRDKELKETDAQIAEGVRSDVDPIPDWCTIVVKKLVKLGIIKERSWINQVSLNDYHTGRLGLGSHYDEERRFARPIISLRLFSESRLSFGLSHHNSGLGTIIIPLKRGRLCVMKDDSYAANDVKHTIRNQDLTHRSASLIMRHVHDDIAKKAKEHCEEIKVKSEGTSER